MNVPINYLAVLVAAVVGFGIGGPWYSFFSRPWLAAIGKTEAEVKRGNAAIAYGGAFAASLMTAYALALLDRPGPGEDGCARRASRSLGLGRICCCTELAHVSFLPLAARIIFHQQWLSFCDPSDHGGDSRRLDLKGQADNQ